MLLITINLHFGTEVPLPGEEIVAGLVTAAVRVDCSGQQSSRISALPMRVSKEEEASVVSADSSEDWRDVFSLLVTEENATDPCTGTLANSMLPVALHGNPVDVEFRSRGVPT